MLAYKMRLAIENPVPTATAVEVPAKRGTGVKLKLPARNKDGSVSRNTIALDWDKFNQKSGREKKSAPVAIFAYEIGEENVTLSLLSRERVLTASDAEGTVKKALDSAKIKLGHSRMTDFREITLKDFCGSLSLGEANGLLSGGYRLYGELGISGVKEYLESTRKRDGCQVSEYIPSTIFVGKRAAMYCAREIMGDKSLLDELKRIYAPDNHKGFVGHPVHYVVKAASRRAAQEIIDVLVAALFANGRLSSRRITYYSDFEPCANMEQSLRTLLSHTGNSTVVLEITGKEPSPRGRLLSGDRNLMDFLADEIASHSKETLFILAEVTDGNESARNTSVISSLHNVVDLLPIREGNGKGETIGKYLNYRAKTAGMDAFSTEELSEAVSVNDSYTPTKAEPIFQALSKTRLRRDFYPSYQDVVFCHEKGVESLSDESYLTQIENLVGLEEPKTMVHRMVANHQMHKVRRELKMKDSKNALHMVFTGNPGSAKTTMARMLAGLLKEKGISSTGNFVECGRSDLVGKYVGWTAKIVKQRFQEAAGGVLFIDEAYSLLDDSNSYGTEAINTIVQEMENHRDDVLVIFAGYPDKMQDFINSNEGLRSRIAAFIDFPDYNAEELTEILQLMAKKRGYRLNAAILKKCRRIFGDVVKEKNFGNGRYVRNLLESAVMRQAERLAADAETEKISRQKASCLSVTDFEPVKIDVRRKKERKVGFYAMGVEGEEE